MSMIHAYGLCCALLAAIPLQEDRLDDLMAEKDHEVVVRGFITQDGEGHWALSSRPPVRSCCQHKGIAHKAILLRIDGDWKDHDPSQVVELRGHLHQHSSAQNFSALTLSDCQLNDHCKTQSLTQHRLLMGLGALVLCFIAFFRLVLCK